MRPVVTAVLVTLAIILGGVAMFVVGILMAVLFTALIAIGLGGLAAWLLGEEYEDRLFLKGMGYAFLGYFLITVGPLPLPVTQVVGVLLARGAARNQRSRWAALAVGLAVRAAPLLFGGTWYPE